MLRSVRWMWRHKILTVIGAFVVLGLLGSLVPAAEQGSGAPLASASSPSPSDSASATPPPEEPTPTPTTSTSTPTAEPSGSAEPSAAQTDVAAAPPTEPVVAPAPTQREIWLASYAAGEAGYLTSLAVALAVTAPPAGTDLSAVRSCAEVAKGLPLDTRIARFTRRAGSAATPEQAVAALDATVGVVCPEQSGVQAEQVAVRTAGIQAAQAAAVEQARRDRAAAKKAAREARREQQRQEQVQAVYYENCTAVEDAGAAPIYRGDPGYGDHLDRDGDGVACET